MQENKNKRLAALLIGLTIVTVITLLLVGNDNRPRVDPGLFRLDDYTGVDRIEIASPKGVTELSYVNSRWRVNGMFNADRELVTVLFAALKQAEPKRAVTAAAGDSIAKALEANGVAISLFEGEKQVQHFYAGGNERKTQAFFYRPGDDRAYVVTIPGYRVYVSGIFELTVNQWREKYVFNFNWTNFKELRATFPGHPGDDYIVRMLDDNQFGIPGMEVDTARLNSFLDEVSLLTANEFLDPSPLTDSLQQARPEMALTISDVSNTEYSLKLYREEGSVVRGILNGKDAVSFSRLKIGAILRPKGYFKKR